MCDFSKYGVPTAEWLRLEATLPVDNVQSLADLKTVTNEGREKLAFKAMELLSDKVQVHDYSILTRDGYMLEARSYRPASIETNKVLPIYVHFHGGGFLFGTLSSEDASCSQIALNVGVVVVNINYRHTPEYTYPIPWNDSEDALVWIWNNSVLFGGNRDKLVIGGTSAGAWLTAALTQTILKSGLNLQPPPKVLGQVLMIPCLVFTACYESQMRQIKDPSLSSYVQCANAPILNSRRKKFFNDLLDVQSPDPDDKRLNPGNVTPEEARDLPPTILGVAGYDPLRDEGLLFGKLLAENGVATNINVFRGVPHGFRRFGEKLSASKQWDEVIEKGIRWALAKPALRGFVIREY